VPDDLLRFVSGPPPYAPLWLWCGLALVAVVIAWCVGVFVWTLPAERLRNIPAVRSVHAKLLRRKFVRTIRSLDQHRLAGDLSAAQTSAQMSRALRSFLHQATGTQAQYMHVDAIKSSDLAKSAPVFSALNDARFNSDSPVEIDEISSAAQELIRSWA
jgi:hypothetical protein